MIIIIFKNHSFIIFKIILIFMLILSNWLINYFIIIDLLNTVNYYHNLMNYLYC